MLIAARKAYGSARPDSISAVSYQDRAGMAVKEVNEIR
jgi:hypothetical protein